MWTQFPRQGRFSQHKLKRHDKQNARDLFSADSRCQPTSLGESEFSLNLIAGLIFSRTQLSPLVYRLLLLFSSRQSQETVAVLVLGVTASLLSSSHSCSTFWYKRLKVLATKIVSSFKTSLLLLRIPQSTSLTRHSFRLLGVKERFGLYHNRNGLIF